MALFVPTVTPFKFTAIKVRGFQIMTYSRPFNFAVFPTKIISWFPTQKLCFPTQIRVGTLCVKDHQVFRLEHRLGLMEILKKHKKIFFFLN